MKRTTLGMTFALGLAAVVTHTSAVFAQAAAPVRRDRQDKAWPDGARFVGLLFARSRCGHRYRMMPSSQCAAA